MYSKEEKREYSRRYYLNHKAKYREYSRRYHLNHKAKYRECYQKCLARFKAVALSHYGNGTIACVMCGFTDIRALSIDHINGGGTNHRRDLGLGGNVFYRWLVKNNFPEGYQVLCMNCQFIKLFRENEFKGKRK